MNNKSGFTLIELLVVIAIIGILSSVVLTSLSSARNKGADAAVKANLAAIRSQAEIFSDNSGNYVGSASGFAKFPTSEPASTATTHLMTACATKTSVTSGVNMFKDSVVEAALKKAAESSKDGNILCAVNNGSYAMGAILTKPSNTSGNTIWWCVDNTSVAREVDNALPGTVKWGSNSYSCP